MTVYSLLGYLCACMALTVAPGPDNIFVITQGITRGRKAAIVTALGMCSGVSVHTTAAALGISAIFYSSALAFNLVKYAGALYLLYLAWKTVRSRSPVTLASGVSLPAAALFRRGFIMNVLNPKVALFFLAFLPQFVTPAAGHLPLQMLLLGGIFMLQAVAIFSLIGWFSGSIGKQLLSRPHVAKYFDWLTAGVFTSLGIKLALAER
ncbi:MAG: transporter, RhtB family [Deltaproteobacteria bacterium]|jgi:threonine/homoserine/homoserine lactone efflux protein|nr:transporter, RhtB family [Deltaproteobacteria bacterium]